MSLIVKKTLGYRMEIILPLDKKIGLILEVSQALSSFLTTWIFLIRIKQQKIVLTKCIRELTRFWFLTTLKLTVRKI